MQCVSLGDVAALISALATAGGVYVAWVGVGVWRRQHTWGIRYEAAKAMLASAHALKGAILAGHTAYETWHRTMGPGGDPLIKAVAARLTNPDPENQLAAAAREVFTKREEFATAAGHIALNEESRKAADELRGLAFVTWMALDYAATDESQASMIAPSDPGAAEEIRRQVPAKLESSLGPLAEAWRMGTNRANDVMEAVEKALRPFIVSDD